MSDELQEILSRMDDLERKQQAAKDKRIAQLMRRQDEAEQKLDRLIQLVSELIAMQGQRRQDG
jgi:tetrahydromethanopterin S-methyltransferase subunit G